jgi:uncharacterized protein (DUF736 family)
MSYEQRENTGALFRNDKKQPGERTPDYRGDAMVNGVKVEIAAWIKESASGKKFMSLKFQEPRERDAAPKAAPAPIPEADFPF